MGYGNMEIVIIKIASVWKCGTLEPESKTKAQCGALLLWNFSTFNQLFKGSTKNILNSTPTLLWVGIDFLVVVCPHTEQIVGNYLSRQMIFRYIMFPCSSLRDDCGFHWNPVSLMKSTVFDSEICRFQWNRWIYWGFYETSIHVV